MNVKLIIDKIKFLKNFESDKELADFFNINHSTLANWKRRSSIDFELVIKKCNDLDFNYLFKN